MRSEDFLCNLRIDGEAVKDVEFEGGKDCVGSVSISLQL